MIGELLVGEEINKDKKKSGIFEKQGIFGDFFSER